MEPIDYAKAAVAFPLIFLGCCLLYVYILANYFIDLGLALYETWRRT